MMRTYGHENASVLDGGFKKWLAEGLRTETTPRFDNNEASDFD